MNRIPVDLNNPEEPEKGFWERVTDVTSVGFAWSMLLHVILLVAMAFVVMPGLTERKGFVVVATDASDDVTTFDSLVDVSFDDSGATESTTEETVELITEATDTPLPLASVVEAKAPSATNGQGDGNSEGSGSGGVRLKAPTNAVRMGSFTAWTKPIRQFRGEEPKAGDSPRPGQSYHIYIQLQLPETMRTYRVGDITGAVVGTDGYRLQLPNRTFFFNNEGRIEEATARKRIPVVDSTVTLLVHIPAAKFEAVRDKITVKSRKLAESQTLELIFTSESRPRQKLRTTPPE